MSGSIRKNNNGQHISSAASSVIFDPTNAPAFDSTITDLQKLGNKIDVHATKPLVTATESVSGVLAIASLNDVIAGISNTKAVTPYTLQQKLDRPNATDSLYGLVRFATVAERTEANASVNVAANTAAVWNIVSNLSSATESKKGTVSISTLTAAQAGVDDTTMMTPAKVKAAIDTFAITSIVTVPSASEIASGTVKIATPMITNPALHAGFAVSPKGFIETRASTTRVGTVKFATQAESNARVATDLALSPSTLPLASSTQLGIVQLATQAGAGVTNKAISAAAATAYINRAGDTMTGNLVVGNISTSLVQGSAPNALVRRDYVDFIANSKSNISHSHTNGSETHTILWSGSIDNGNFVLNARWDSFDSIIFESSDDRNYWYDITEFSKSNIKRMQENYPNFSIVRTALFYWYGKFASDAKTFLTSSENCRIRKVIGVNKTVY